MSLRELYNIDHVVSYQTNQEYRDCLRKVFSMKGVAPDCNGLADDETRDEMNYDEATLSVVMDLILEKTLGIPAFDELYLLGAAKMISESKDIGMVILMSYDFFPWFHICLGHFLRTGQLSTTDSVFLDLRGRLI
jgi:hypothetical protein